MRILHLGKFFPPHPGGMETFLAALMRAEAARGLASRAICHARPGQASAESLAGGADLASGQSQTEFFARSLSPSSEFALAPALPALARLVCRKFDPDAVCLHMPNVSGMLAALGLDKPLVAFWHAPVRASDISPSALAFLPAYRLLERTVLRRARRIVVTSRSMLDGCPELARHRHKCRVVPLGIELPPTSPSSTDAGGFERPVTILSLGRFAPYKGFDVLVRALALVPGARLIMAGDGPERAAVMALAKRLGLSNRIAFPGRVDDAARDSLYASCDIFCLPSLSPAEAFGLVLLEAMARGKPVAAARPEWSGVGEVVEHGVTGMLVPPGDPAALASALRTLANDAALARRMGEAGARRVRALYSIDTAAGRMERVYAAVAGYGRA